MTSRQRLANARINAVSIVKAKLSGAERFASRPTLQGRVHFNIRGRATFGAQFIAEGHIIPVSIFVAQGATLTVGNHVYLNAGATIEVWHEVRIGSNVQLAPNASVIDDDRHKVEPDAVLYKGPTVIGDNVWLGRNAVVLPGATIGDGSVIGANSVVTKDVPPGVFAAGAPARVIRKLDLPDGWYRS